MGVVYKVTNVINKKIYVGKTSGDLDKRKRQHKWNSLNGNSQTYFHKAIRKYGFDNFEWSILFEPDDEHLLLEKEIFFIEEQNATKDGYNLTIGGEGVTGFKFSEETKAKMREKNLGKTLSDEHKRKISEGGKGRVVTEETRSKISNSQKGKARKTFGEKHGYSKLTEKDVIEIKEMLLKGEFQKEIAKKFNVSRTNITSINNGHTWSHIKINEGVK